MPKPRLEPFVVALASDTTVRSSFLTEPDAAMGHAGLSDEERAVVGTGKLRIVLDFLSEDPRPTIPEIQSGGGSGGSGSGERAVAAGLGPFLAILASDPTVRSNYLLNPADAIHDARLTPEEEAVLGTDDLTTILSYLDKGDPGPSTPDILSGGTGSGQSGGGKEAVAS